MHFFFWSIHDNDGYHLEVHARFTEMRKQARTAQETFDDLAIKRG